MITSLAFEVALVAREPLNVDIVLLGKMIFQIATTFAFVPAYVACRPFNVDIVHVGTVTFQIASIIAFVLAHVVETLCRWQGQSLFLQQTCIRYMF